MVIQHNITAMKSQRSYSKNDKSLAKNLEKLASGYSINRAADDAAGLAISERLRAQITGLDTAKKNAADAISVVQSSEGAMEEIHAMLDRMYELAEQSCNGIYGDAERQKLQDEFSRLTTEIDRISSTTNFNGMKLLDGSLSDNQSVTAKFDALRSVSGADTTGVPSGSQYIAAIDLTKANITEPGGMASDSTGANVSMGFANTPAPGKLTVTIDPSSTYTYSLPENTKLNSGDQITLSDGNDPEGTITVTLNKDIDTTKAISPAETVGRLYDAKNVGGERMTLQIGDTAAEYNRTSVNVESLSADALGLGGLNIGTYDGAVVAMNAILTAIDKVSGQRGNLGAIQNRLEHTINNLGTMAENVQEAESTIRDTDMAEEMSAYTKNNILLQSAQSMMAQANQLPQGVIQMLQQ